MLLSSYVSPEEASGEVYFSELRRFDDALRKIVASELEGVFGSEMDWAIVTPGSDGRLEKSPASTMELIVLHDGRLNVESEARRLREFVNKAGPRVFTQDIDVKQVDREGLNWYGDDKSRVFPTRMTDSLLVTGNAMLHDMAKLRLVDEWFGQYGKIIFDRVADKRREARKVLSAGGKQRYRQKDVRHYDADAGISWYDPENFLLSFKAGPLRAVQTGVIRAVIKHCRQSEMAEAKPLKSYGLVSQMPTNTGERLDYLTRSRVLGTSVTEARELADHYNHFLFLYHCAEHAYWTRGEKSVQISDKKEAHQRLSSISQLVEKLDK
ncbi:hypothetical protein HY489_00535 [Candidatus Woesearchaeota archaeon]|nr:hypothetical protein [Candidatus Woesearchaeota archaeon]